MKWISSLSSRSLLFVAALFVASCAGMGGGGGTAVKLTGAEEVPPVKTDASGSGSVTVGDDRSVSGSFKLQNAAHMSAGHIHEGAAGNNGPVIVPLRKVSDTDWEVTPGAKLTDAQYDAYKAGRLYVNFHSPKNKGGEIRGQIRPSGGGGGY
jgi:hypothetical protein